MEFKEFGLKQKKVALLIHGGYATWKTLRVQIDLLSQDYRVIVPILNGHNINDCSELLSIEQEAEQIIEYIDKQNICEIEILYGASLGADIALEILSSRNRLIKHAVVESGSLGISRIASFFLIKVTVLIMYYGARENWFFSKILNRSLANLKMPKDLYQETKELLKYMSKLTLKNVQHLVCNYRLKEEIKNTTAKILVIYSTKEKYLVRPYNEMKKLVSNMQILCVEGYSHGELCVGNPNKVVNIIKSFTKKGEL